MEINHPKEYSHENVIFRELKKIHKYITVGHYYKFPAKSVFLFFDFFLVSIKNQLLYKYL